MRFVPFLLSWLVRCVRLNKPLLQGLDKPLLQTTLDNINLTEPYVSVDVPLAPSMLWGVCGVCGKKVPLPSTLKGRSERLHEKSRFAQSVRLILSRVGRVLTRFVWIPWSRQKQRREVPAVPVSITVW